MVFGWRRGTSTRCDTNTSLSQIRYSLRGSIFSWSPSRGTVLRLVWRFVDLRRRATPMWTVQDRAPRMKIVILVGLSSTASTTRKVIIPDSPTTFEALAISVGITSGPPDGYQYL